MLHMCLRWGDMQSHVSLGQLDYLCILPTIQQIRHPQTPAASKYTIFHNMPATDLKLMVSLELPHVYWHHALTIPEADLHRFCIHPLKWVRYLGFTIVGVSGHLSRKANGGPIQSYTGATSRHLGGQYFYIADGQNIRPQCDGTHIHPTPNMS